MFYENHGEITPDTRISTIKKLLGSMSKDVLSVTLASLQRAEKDFAKIKYEAGKQEISREASGHFQHHFSNYFLGILGYTELALYTMD